MIDQEKAMLARLRQTFRTMASTQGIESPLWEYVSAIDTMRDTGKCDLAQDESDLIELCVKQLEEYINAEQA